MLKVLWLCSWYPNNIEPFNGDFVQRHAQATSLLNKIHVIKLTPDPGAKAVTRVTRNFQQWPNLGETFVYYPKPQSFIGKTVSYFRWYSLYKYAIETFIEKYGKPDIVHVHIPYKAGAMARFIKRKFHIPYVVTEHWGGYNNVVENNYKERQSYFKNVVKDTLKGASALHSVSKYVGEQINKLVYKTPYTVIPNVVNTTLFNYRPVENTTGKFRLIHISSGVPVKNVPGIIEAFGRLNKDEYEFTIVGLPAEQNELYSRMYPFINFTGEVPYSAVADHLNNADALVIFSNIENSPCIIGEALCCGVPVIATNVGGIPELVNYTNSILVEPGNIDELVNEIGDLRANIQSYNKQQIAEYAIERFSYTQIGFETDLWYKTILLSAEGL